MYVELMECIRKALHMDKVRCDMCFAQIRNQVIFTDRGYIFCSSACAQKVISDFAKIEK